MHRVCGILLLLWVFLTAGPAYALTAPEWTRLRAGEILIGDIDVIEGGSVEAIFFVAAPLAVARDVLWDHEHFPNFMPHARWAKVLERKGPVHVVEQGGGQGPFTVVIVSERRLSADRISWHSIRGDIKRNDGFWAFESVDGGTLLTYRIHVVPKGPVPKQVTAFLTRQALPAMVYAVRQRILSMARPRATTPAPGHPKGR